MGSYRTIAAEAEPARAQAGRGDARGSEKRENNMTHLCWVLISATPYHLARVEATRAAGFEVTMIEICGRDAFIVLETPMAEDPRRVILFPGQKFADAPRRQLPRRVAAALDKLAPDVIAINGWSEGGAIAALRWSLRHSVPVVLCSDSSAHDEPRVWWKEWIKARIVRLCGAFLVGGAVHADYIRLLLS